VPEKEVYQGEIKDDPSFAAEDWAEAFGYIQIHIRCLNCQKFTDTWVGRETM